MSACTRTTTSTPSASSCRSRRRRAAANGGRLFHNHARERLRILGEIPLRTFAGNASRSVTQPLDPDGNPDTSFLAKIPADSAFTFQTIDKPRHGAELGANLAPASPRRDASTAAAVTPTASSRRCSRRPRAGQPEYAVWDLINTTPLVTDKERDESKKQWDVKNETGLRYANAKPQAAGAVNVEYHRDIKPILQRSCIACHTAKDGKDPAGNLNLDSDDEQVSVENLGKFPGTYVRLALDERAKFGHKPVAGTAGARCKPALHPQVPARQRARLEDLRRTARRLRERRSSFGNAAGRAHHDLEGSGSGCAKDAGRGRTSTICRRRCRRPMR